MPITTSSPTSPGSRLHRAKNWVFIALFMTMIWLPLLDSAFELDHAPQPQERRLRAPFPELKPGAQGAREFFSGLDKYYSDHFGFRNWLVRRQNRWKHKWFREAALPAIVQGRDGWYYYVGMSMIDDAAGRNRFDDATLRAWRDLLETRRDWLAGRGVAYLFVVPPDKHTIYPEYLPDWVSTAPDRTKLSQFVAYMKANSTVAILDLRPALSAAKKTVRVYQYTDPHWDYEGGFVAYQEIVRALAKQLPGIVPLDTTQFTRSYTTREGGDLARMLGLEQLLEKNYPILSPLPPLKEFAVSTDLEIYPKKWRKGTDPRISENPDASGTAIVFRDSFAYYWEPFLGYHFNRVIYIWQYNWNPELIEREKPLVVIDEILEQLMNNANPEELKAEDGLNPSG